MTDAALPIVFLAGVLSATSPCILPILPPLLAGSTGHRLKPVAIVTGSILTFTLMGGAFSYLGAAFGTNRIVLRGIFALVIMLFGLVLLDPYAEQLFSNAAARATSRVDPKVETNRPLLGGLLLGASLGIVWIPCIGPVLGPVLAIVAFERNVVQGSLLLFVYGLGLAVPLLAVAYGGKAAASRLRWLEKRSHLAKRAAGAVLIATGLAVLFGLDTYLVNRLYPYFPNLQELLAN